MCGVITSYSIHYTKLYDVLAAGMGSRYGGLKQMDGFGPSGETIIEYSVYDAIRAGFGKIVFVIRKEIEADFRERFGERFESRIQVEYVYQELNKIPAGLSVPADRTKPWGTGRITSYNVCYTKLLRLSS